MSVMFMIFGLISALIGGLQIANGGQRSALPGLAFAILSGMCFIASAIAYVGEAMDLKRKKKEDHDNVG